MAKPERIAPNAAFAMQLPESGVLLWPATYQKPSNSPLGLLAFRTHEGWLVPGQGSVGVVLGNPRAAEAWAGGRLGQPPDKSEFCKVALSNLHEILGPAMKPLSRLADFLNQ